MKWTKKIPSTEITDKVTSETVNFAKEFGIYLANKNDMNIGIDSNGKERTYRCIPLTTSQLRKFFGEVKRQQMKGYNETDFVLLKPKLAYAVGRAKDGNAKINDFYAVISDAIDKVKTEDHFRNFIKIFEAIVAYHKAAEDSNFNN